jgi:hypothetical protein
MKKTLLIASLLAISIQLTGCAAIEKSPIGQFTLADAQTASAMAKAANDTAAQKCYDYLASSIQSSGQTGTCGLLCLNETKRTAITATTNLGQSCGGVIPLIVAP